MQVEVQYYGMIADLLQKDAERIELKFDSTTLELKEHFESIYPELKKMTYQIAVDQNIKEQIGANDQIKEIALLPPFAGG